MSPDLSLQNCKLVGWTSFLSLSQLVVVMHDTQTARVSELDGKLVHLDHSSAEFPPSLDKLTDGIEDDYVWVCELDLSCSSSYHQTCAG